MNQAIIIGRLTRDPEVRYTQSGTAVCTFTLVLNTCTLHRSPRNTSCNYRREAI